MPRKTKKTIAEEAFNAKYYAEEAEATKEMEKALRKQSLLFCLFCDAQPGEDGPELVRTNAHCAWIECAMCGAQGPHAYHESKIPGIASKAIAYWNASHRSSGERP